MTAREYADKVVDSDFHFPHPNVKKLIEQAYLAGMEEQRKAACEWLKINTYEGGKMQLFFTKEWRDVFVDDFRKAMADKV